MTTDQQQLLEQIRNSQEHTASLWKEYWVLYSNLSTWQFGLNVAFLLIPLIILWRSIDRSKAFQIGFFGLNAHIWFTYIDLIGVRNGLWEYPYKVAPFIPMNTALDVSFVPVFFMLVYQWTINHKKNYYVYGTLASAFMAFIFKPIMTYFDLFALYKWMNFLYLFVGYMVICLLSKWITNVFNNLKEGNEIGDDLKSTEAFGAKERAR